MDEIQIFILNVVTPKFVRVSILALEQSYDCPGDSEVALKNVDKIN